MAEKTFIYLLWHETEPVFKVGKSVNVWNRMAQLPDAIDIERSRLVGFGDGKLALKLEKFCHTLFKQHCRPRPHRSEGYTEWYDVAAFDDVLGFIDSNRKTFGCGPVRPIPAKKTRPSVLQTHRAKLSPQERVLLRKQKMLERMQECIQENAIAAEKLMRWLTTLQQRNAMVGWHKKTLVVWLDASDKDEVIGMMSSSHFRSVNGGFSLFGSISGDAHGLYRFHFSAEPEALAEEYSSWGVDALTPVWELLSQIPNVPQACIPHLEVLEKSCFWEVLKASENEQDEHAHLFKKVVSRLLAEVVEDRRPVPSFEQYSFECL